MFNYQILVEAGLRPRHMTRLCDVSRVTASNWLRGATQPHLYIRETVDKIVDAAQRAVDDGELPVSPNLSSDERSVKTLSTIRKYMGTTDEYL